MHEHLDERARECILLAHVEARRFGHDEIGTVHLLLGVAATDPPLVGVGVEALRAKVVALHGSAAPSNVPVMPFSAEAKAALDGANSQALRFGHTTIDHAHLLLALLDAGGGAARALREAGVTPGDVRERATALAGSGPQPPRPAVVSWSPGAAGGDEAPQTPPWPHPFPVGPREPRDHAQDLRDGHALPVSLGADATPIGDLGHPDVDRALLDLMLVNETPAARLLRNHGIDEARLQEVFGPPGGRG